MKKYLLRIFTVCVILMAMVLGIVKRQTYTDLTSQEDYLDRLQVAELPENIAETQYAVMQQELPAAPMILRVEVTGEIEHFFGVDRQKAVVREIYAGDWLEEDQEIYIFSDCWRLVLDGNPNSIERGFVNIMKTGEEYLIFVQEVVENADAEILSVNLGDEFIVAPVFSYEEHKNVVVPVTGETTYVSYCEVRENEFFAGSEKAMHLLEMLKKQMLLLYPEG